MKLRVFVDYISDYNSIVIDTDDLGHSCINRSTGRVHFFEIPDDDDSLFKDCLPTIFISDLINDLIDKN